MYATVIDKATKKEYEVKASKNGENPQPCPVCREDRKPGNKNKQCFSYNVQKQVGKCQNCDANFYLKREETESKYVVPEWENKTQLSDKLVEWFLKRNISQAVLSRMRITETSEFMPQVEAERNVIGFNYFRDGKLVNTKFRDGAKNFKMVKGAEKILYNLDGIKDQKEIYIVEGEIDCLTMVQVGHENTVSVPNGANKKTNNLDYLDNCWQYFEQAEKVFIATDQDEPGEQLANELSRRIGVEKCYRIFLGEFKDVNEQFCKVGSVDVSDARPYPISGIFNVEDHWEAFLRLLRDGFPKGWKPRGLLGNHLAFHPGYTTIVTGIPGHGKSEFLDQVLLQLCIDYDLRGGYFTPENWPTELHILKLVEKICGISAFRLNPLQMQVAKNFLSKRILWVYPEEDYTLDTILDKMRQAVLKFGINWFVLDPWNKLEHLHEGESETKYVSQCLDKISNFNKKNGTHAFIVAHPTKMRFNYENDCYEVPGLYDISGSANFYNKADIGIVAYKEPHEQYVTRLIIQKVKFKYWGSIGELKFNWDHDNGRYTENGKDFTNWITPTAETKLIDFSQTRDKEEVPF